MLLVLQHQEFLLILCLQRLRLPDSAKYQRLRWEGSPIRCHLIPRLGIAYVSIRWTSVCYSQVQLCEKNSGHWNFAFAKLPVCPPWSPRVENKNGKSCFIWKEKQGQCFDASEICRILSQKVFSGLFFCRWTSQTEPWTWICPTTWTTGSGSW